jgi:polyisoprenoid-binding protein YceI
MLMTAAYNTHNSARRTFIGATAAALLLSPFAFTLGGVSNATAAAPAASAEITAEQASGAYGVDKLHTDITFTVPHLVVSKVRGRFNDFDGTVKVDGTKPENSSVAFAIKVASVDTGNAQRDGHLKSADFFDAEKYPEMTFKSSQITRRKGGGFNALGTLTIHGVSKQVTLPFTVSGPVKGPDGALHLGVETALKINRQAYGLTWSKLVEGSALVGDQVDISINLDLAKQATAQKTASR